MLAISSDLGVFRSMQGHLCGQTKDAADSNARQIARELRQEQELNWVDASKPSANKSYIHKLTPEEEIQSAERNHEITQLNAGTMDMNRYLNSILEGTIEGPVPVSHLIARQNYEAAMQATS